MRPFSFKATFWAANFASPDMPLNLPVPESKDQVPSHVPFEGIPVQDQANVALSPPAVVTMQ